RRVRKGQIGFQAEPVQVMDNELFQHVTTQDFIQYGFEPEFIGRLPVRVVCEDLDADDLFNIMKHSEGSLLRQYERAFRAYGIEISFEDEALRLLAEAAAKEKTGARGLLTVFEKLFRDYKYYLAGSGLSQLLVTTLIIGVAVAVGVGALHATKTIAGFEAVAARLVSDTAGATRIVSEKWQYVFILLIALGVAWFSLSKVPRWRSRLLLGLFL